MCEMYDVYLDKILLPVAPSKIQLKVKNRNKTVTLINDGEISILKQAGLTEVSFSVLIPQTPYPFAKYKSGFQNAAFFLDAFEKLKTGSAPFQLVVSRILPNGTVLFDTNIKVALEDYSITDDAKNGFDITVDINLKQYRDYGTKTFKLKTQQGEAKAEIQPQRSSESAPATRTYTVVKGDTLWAIAKKYYNDGNQYPRIFDANKEKISNPNLIYSGQVLIIP